MNSFFKDTSFALRSLRKSPGFTLVAAIMIGLGIGACTAIFSVVNAVLLKPLPYSEPERLVLVWSELRARNVMDFPFPIPDVKDLREETTTFEDVAGLFPPGRVTVATEGGPPEQIRSAAVTANLFSVLGAAIQHGRNFTDEDGTPQPPQQPAAGGGPQQQAPPLPIMAILSHHFWQRKYGADPSIVGKSISVGNGRAQIVGVLPPEFELLLPPRTGIDPAIDMFTALRLNFETAARNVGALRVIARMKSGVSLEAARTEAEGLAAVLRERWPTKKNADVHFRVVPMHEDLVRDVRTSILALFGAVVFVLLIACANIANLLVVRASARQRELVIRAAIGGSRGRLIQQMLTESLLLAGAGAVLGLGVAQAGIRFLLMLAPDRLPRLTSISLDPWVLVFSAAATLATALICGLVPAIRASRPDIVDVLRTSGATGLRSGRRLRPPGSKL